MTNLMNKSLVMFPAAYEQKCYNCKAVLGIREFHTNMVEMTKDACGMPAVIVRCPVCKTPIEWETRGN